VVWQRGLVEREINELLREITRDDDDEERKKPKKVFSIMINKLLILIITFIE
jgi:hypothetical protein